MQLDEPLSGIRILLVDDEVALLEPQKINLELVGARVETATSGKQAFEIFEDGKFDVVLTDIKMVDGDGPDLIRRIRESGSKVPIICTSGFSGHNDKSIEELGANGFIEKPFSPPAMVDEILKLARSSSK